MQNIAALKIIYSLLLCHSVDVTALLYKKAGYRGFSSQKQGILETKGPEAHSQPTSVSQPP